MMLFKKRHIIKNVNNTFTRWRHFATNVVIYLFHKFLFFKVVDLIIYFSNWHQF